MKLSNVNQGEQAAIVNQRTAIPQPSLNRQGFALVPFLNKHYKSVIIFTIGIVCGWVWALFYTYIIVFFIGYFTGYIYLSIKKRNTNHEIKDKDK
jgi:Ca2+-dependent lipid-binding protein